MKLYATAEIDVDCDSIPAETRSKLRKIRRELEETLDDAANAVFARYGIYDGNVHTVILSDLDVTEDSDNEY